MNMKESEPETSRFNIWPLGIVLFFLMVFAVNALFIWKASQQPSDLVSSDYYEQSQAYEQVIDAQRMTAKSGWSAKVTPIHEADQTRMLVDVQDANGEKLSGLKGHLQAYRPSDSSLDETVTLHEIEAGRYEALLKRLLRGSWKITITFENQEGNPVFIQTHPFRI
ncbi:MAG: FixH family protein [SAR324 cluster bacterium]|nr:FixH family protein [SAR324 cluster bacterium]